MDNICVAVRVRPSVSNDSSNGTYWKVEDNRVSLQKTLGTPIHGNSYSFDHVFDESCSNARVYELLASDIIHAAVEGFNGTAFAYGQTSSGKTFTMNGSETNPGIILLAINDIFDKIQRINNREFLVRVSYMEIYNEEIIDLLAIENQKLQIKESLDRGIFVAGLKEEIVNNAEQVLNLIELGEVNRHFGETNMNIRSSRSHSIFRMVIESHGKHSNSVTGILCSDAVRVSVLNLVDLAGSERIAKTGAGGIRLKEGKYINKSLLILGNVINKLSDGAKQKGHIPYRDSKLTRILQPALGGNAKTSIICTIAPEEIHIEETKGTLMFASRAKRVTNCAQVNEILTDAALLKRQKLEIEELRQKLQGSHSGVQEQEILKLRNEMLKYEVEREKLELKLEEERKLHQEERDQYIKEQQIKIDSLKNPVTSDCERNSIEGCMGQIQLKENSSRSICEEENVFTTPFKAIPSSFISKRTDRSTIFACSPLPDESYTVADEDMWFRMNNGHITNLDLLQMTPAGKTASFPARDAIPNCLIKLDEDEIHSLRKQLQQALEDKIEIERNYKEQMICNNGLLNEISNLQNEAALMYGLPERLRESVIIFRDICSSVLSIIESLDSDENSPTSELLSTTRELSSSLFSNLEAQFSRATEGHQTSTSGNNSLIQDSSKLLHERLITISSSLLSEASTVKNKVPGNSTCNCRDKELETMNANLEKELDLKNQFSEDAKQRCKSLERELELLKEDRDSLHRSLSKSLENLSKAGDEKEKLLEELSRENGRRRRVEQEIKQFGDVLSERNRSMMRFYSEMNSQIQKFGTQTPKSSNKTLGW